MDRKEFLSLVGISAAAFATVSCLDGCSKSPLGANPPSVNFTLNLADPANSALTHNGGYMYMQGVIIARTNTGAFLAVSQTCPHMGNTVVYESGVNDFYCPAHNSTFATNGQVTGGPSPQNLKSYNTQLISGSSLHVWG
ncbi:MAG TPA: Rieske (2Fe-2S) protein [Bacteroidia bacterium]|jgi:cytochrome b6-f complex iron-sulfur subunit|nr:Rieske (2Fe-2S) protein [Bacteroidia bacterium]